MITFEMLRPGESQDVLGYLPTFLSEQDLRPAREQLDSGYSFAGGYRPLKGFKVSEDGISLEYPGDPPMPAIARVQLRDETIIVYECAWVAIFQKSGTFVVARMD